MKSAIDDAKTFLYRHPHVQTADDPIELLRALLAEAITHRDQAVALSRKVAQVEAALAEKR